MRTSRNLLSYHLIFAFALITGTGGFAQHSARAAQVAGQIDESQLVILKGNTPPAATIQNDRGPVSPSLAMTDLFLVLQRSPAQQAAFDEFVASQYDPSSPNFHQWLTPAEVGETYGQSSADIAAISSWLTGHGFSIDPTGRLHEECEERAPDSFCGLSCQCGEEVMRTRHMAWWLVVLCGANVVAAGSSNSTSIRGHIVAFRPAERLGQVVSGVVNRETFLLRVDGKAGEIVKVVYEHDGYSELSGAAAERNAGLALEVHRDRSCDGNYGQFVSEAPVLTSEDKTDSIPPRDDA